MRQRFRIAKSGTRSKRRSNRAHPKAIRPHGLAHRALHLEPLEDRPLFSIAPLNIALISDAVAQAPQIQAAATNGTIAIVYDADTMTTQGLVDILASISAAHDGARIEDIAIVAHGSAGEIDLGTGDDLNLATLPGQATALGQVRSLLTNGASLDLYSCSVAAGASGKNFVDELAAVTGAVVYASDRPVGTVPGADLHLDYHTGQAAAGNGLFSDQEMETIAGLYLYAYTSPANVANGLYYNSPNNLDATDYNVGQCTWYVYGRIQETTLMTAAELSNVQIPNGNGTYHQIFTLGAGTWLSDAQSSAAAVAGITTGTTPKPGAIACYASHVAFVENTAGQMTESNLDPRAQIPPNEVVVDGVEDTSQNYVWLHSSEDASVSTRIWQVPQFTVMSLLSGPLTVPGNSYQWFELGGTNPSDGKYYTGYAALLDANTGIAAPAGDETLNFTGIQRSPGTPWISTASVTGYIYLPSSSSSTTSTYLTGAQVAQAAYDAGFRGSSLVYATAIADAESDFELNATDSDSNGTTDYGLWQINSSHGYNSSELLSSPDYNADAAYTVSNEGTNWDPWAAFWGQGQSASTEGAGIYLNDLSGAITSASAIDSTVVHAIGDSVAATTNGVYVRNSAGGTPQTEQRNIGDTGVVIGSYQTAQIEGSGKTYIWWEVRWSDGEVGWSAQDYLKRTGSASSSTPPTASLAVAINPPALGQMSLTFTVTYTDTAAINATSVANSYLMVTGPNGIVDHAILDEAPPTSNAATVIATYSMNAPGGAAAWGPANNGTYKVSLPAGDVSDAAGIYVAPETFNPSFTVAINTNNSPPAVTSFPSAPESVALGNSVTIPWTVSDIGGPGLKQFELLRAPVVAGAIGTWVPVQTESIPGSGPVSSSFPDTPPSAGLWDYEPLVIDSNGTQTPSATTSFTPLQVTVGSGSGPQIDVQSSAQGTSVHAYNFNSVTSGFSETAAFTIVNEGTQPLDVSEASLVSSQFQIALDDPAHYSAIPAGASRTFSLTFAPTVTGPLNATLTFTSNDPNQPSYTINLSGLGVGPATPGIEVTGGSSNLSIFNFAGDPSAADGTQFDFAPLNSTPETQTYTVTNTGTGNLELGAVSVPAGFALVTPPASSVPAGKSTSFTVQMNTNQLMPYHDANISFTTNAWIDANQADGPVSTFEFAIDGAVELAAPIITGISNDTGRSSSDGITNDPNLRVYGTAIPNSTVTLRFGSNQVIGTASVDSSGDWSFDNTGTTIPDGGWYIFATDSDQAGDPSLWSTQFNVIVDTAAPAPPAITSITTSSGASSTNGPISQFSLAIAGTAEANSLVTVFDDGTAVGTTLADQSSGAWSFKYSPTTLTSGTHQFTATATDVAGNQSSPSRAYSQVVNAPTIAGAGLFNGDPNNLIGPVGFGPTGIVLPTQALSYTISFSNEVNATIPVQQVVITDPLDANLDWSTFQVGEFNIGGTAYTVPTNNGSFNTRIDLTSTLGVYVDVSAGINLTTGIATWTFTSIDPTTGGVPTSLLTGFLPPDQNAPQGEAFVTYTIQPQAADPTGTLLNAQASIVFDTNPAVATPQVTNTIAAGPLLSVSTTSLTLPATNQGTAGAAASFTVSGFELGSGDTVNASAPSGSEISKDGATFSNSILLTPDASGNLSATTLYIRTSASATASVSGNLTITDGLDSSLNQSVPVSGTVQPPVVPTQLQITSQPPSTVGAGSAFGFTVKAEDSQGNAATSFTGSVVIALANNPGGSTLGGTLTVSAVNGVAVFSDLTLNNIGSDYTLQATSNGLASATTAAINVQIGTVTVNDTNSGSSDNVGVTFIDATHYNVTVNGVSTTYSTLNDNKFIYDGPTGASSEFIFDDPTGVYSAVQTLSGTTLVNSSGFEADLNNVSTLYVYLTSPGSTATVNVADGGATSSNFYVGAVNGGYSYIANPISHISSFLVGFGNETVTGSGDTTYAYIYSTSQARTVLDPGGSMFAVGGVTTTLNNFPQVYAVGAVDGTDSITLHSEGGTCVGQASFSYAKGTYNGGPFLVGALYAANVTAEATNPTDPAYFYNTESTDTFNGARGTSNLTGVPIGLEVAAVKFTTFVAQAVGFQSINVEEWNPTYNFTNPMGIDNLTSPGNGTFTETSTVSALTVGTSVITVNTYSENSSQQFVAVASQMNVTGAGNGTDMSVLYDAPGTNTLTAGGSTAKLTTPVNTVTVNSFGKVTANQQNSTNDTEQQTAALDFALTMVGNWTNA